MTGARGVTRRPYAAIAGHPALDVVNTVAWRLSPSRWGDRLIDFDDAVACMLQFGLIDDQAAGRLHQQAQANPVLAEAELERVRELREGLYTATYLQAEWPSPPSAVREPTASAAGAELVASEYADAISAGRLESSSTTPGAPWGWGFDVDFALPRRRLALAAVDLLTGVTPEVLGQCADDECGWVFVDTSPRHNRRWCVAADCGNRNRVRRYNERARHSPGPDVHP